MKAYTQPIISVNYYYLESAILLGPSNHIVESDKGIKSNGVGAKIQYAL